MSVYIVSRVTIADKEAMGKYMRAAPETVAEYGGTYLARTSNFENLEGTSDHDRMVILEFPDKAAALEWYNSTEYAPLRQNRWDAADANIILVEGETPAV